MKQAIIATVLIGSILGIIMAVGANATPKKEDTKASTVVSSSVDANTNISNNSEDTTEDQKIESNSDNKEEVKSDNTINNDNTSTVDEDSSTVNNSSEDISDQTVSVKSVMRSFSSNGEEITKVGVDNDDNSVYRSLSMFRVGPSSSPECFVFLVDAEGKNIKAKVDNLKVTIAAEESTLVNELASYNHPDVYFLLTHNDKVIGGIYTKLVFDKTYEIKEIGGAIPN